MHCVGSVSYTHLGSLTCARNIIAAMMFLAQVKDPVRALMEMDKSGEERKMF